VWGGASCWNIPLDATMSQPLGLCGGCPKKKYPTVVTTEAHINPPPTPWCLVIPWLHDHIMSIL